MLFTPHILSGMMFGGFSSNPLVSSCLGTVSFFILEIIPHWDPENKQKKWFNILHIFDFSLGFISFIIISGLKDFAPKYVLGGIFAALPYIFFYIALLLQSESSFFQRVTKIKSRIKYTDRSSWGILVQFAVCIIALTIIFNLIDFPTFHKFKEQLGIY